MHANHVVVWLDHSEAHIIAFSREAAERVVVVHAPRRHEHQHHRADSVGSGKAAEHPSYYEEIITKIRAFPEWLIVGPANAKVVFMKHLSKHHADLLDRVMGIETVDHPSDGQVLSFARKFFVAADRMAGGPA